MENEVKEAVPKYDYITASQYLEMERSAEFKQEYYDGHIYAMSGASLEHNIIASNLSARVGHFLDGKNCRMLQSEMRVSTPSRDSYMYPDAIIVCGEPELEDDKFDTLLNPSVIFEILSPSTRSIDKEGKFFFYREIPSLQEYVMIDSLKRHIIVAQKQAGDSWKFEDIDKHGFEFIISTIDFIITLEAVYSGTSL
ncbi:MAG: Uma2 family endonuclease [Chitinophagales bacterium]